MSTAESTMIGRLKLIRKELGLTQQEFAVKTDISYGFYIQLERGAKSITDRTIKRICDHINVSERWLRFGEGRMFADAHQDAADNRRDAFNFFVRVFNLTPDKQLQLATFAGYDVDAAEIYAQSNDTAKRNVARLVKAIDRGSVGRAITARG